jgi:hypothetical protein
MESATRVGYQAWGWPGLDTFSSEFSGVGATLVTTSKRQTHSRGRRRYCRGERDCCQATNYFFLATSLVLLLTYYAVLTTPNELAQAG